MTAEEADAFYVATMNDTGVSNEMDSAAGEPIELSPKLTATISDSVQLAVLVWRELQGRRCFSN